MVRRRGDYHVHIPKEHNRVCNEDHYITDIYCQTRHTFLVPYPIPLIVGVCLGGVLAFMLVGFLGYGGPALAGHLAPFVDCPSGIGVDTSKCLHDDIAIFYAPWPLYVWLSALMITLQISVLRHPKLRGRLIATLVVTLVSTVVVGIAYYGNTGLLRRILDFITSGILVNLGTNPWFYTLLNFGLILLFVADSARRWLNRARGFNPNGDLFGTLTPADENTPRVDELVSGDLIAGFVLIGALALIFTPTVVSFVTGITQVYPPCLHGATGCPINANDLRVPAVLPLGGTDLAVIDRLIALVCLPLGVLILALSAVLGGLSAVGAVETPELHQFSAQRDAQAENVTAQVGLVVFYTLRASLDRRVRAAVESTVLSLRNVLWPVLIFVASFFLAALSRTIQIYLHVTPKSPILWVENGLLVVGAAAAVVVSIAMLLLSGHVARNVLQFMRWVGLVLLLTFWLFSLALFGFNELLKQGGYIAKPFIPLSFSTYLSLGVLVIYGGYYFFTRMRKGAQPATARAGASGPRPTANGGATSGGVANGGAPAATRPAATVAAPRPNAAGSPAGPSPSTE